MSCLGRRIGGNMWLQNYSPGSGHGLLMSLCMSVTVHDMVLNYVPRKPEEPRK